MRIRNCNKIKPAAVNSHNEILGTRWTSSEASEEISDVPIRVCRPNEPIESMRARLLYQVRKRGILETDLLLSTYFTKDRLASMDKSTLIELEYRSL